VAVLERVRVARRRRRLIVFGGVGLVVLTVVFGVVAYLVPGPVTPANVQSALSDAVGSPALPKCSGALSAMHCTVQDDSGTPSGRYLIHASGSCWDAARQGEPTGETAFPATAHGCVRLWDDIFPTGFLRMR
jgi:hypothetical protein